MTLIPDLQHDLVDAAARLKRRRQRYRLWLRLTPAVAVAAALIAATVLIFGGGGSDRAPSSPEPTGSPQRSSPGTPPERSPQPPPRRGRRPMPGSLSQPVRFQFAGVGYSIVGFSARSGSRDGLICARLVQRGGGRGRRLVGETCAGERPLRRELDNRPAHIVGGGGQPRQIAGFARADVASINVGDSRYPSRVVLSEPWSPEPWQAEPIRFFLALIDAPPDRSPRALPRLLDDLRLEARLTSGELVDVVP